MTRFAKVWPSPPGRWRGTFLALAFSFAFTPVALLTAAPGANAQSNAPSAAVLLQQMRAAESQSQFTATQVRTRAGVREVAKIERDGLKRRLEWLEPDARRGDVLTDDGKTVSLYHRADNAVTRTRSSARVPDFGSGWKATREGDTFVLTRGTARLRLDADRKIILAFASGGTSVVLQNVKFGPVADARFSFSPPPGVKVTRADGTFYGSLRAAQTAQKWFKAPATTPGGYDFESAIVSGSEAWLRFSNGSRRLSLFQQKADGASVAPREVEGGTFWKSGGLRFLLTGGSETERRSFVTALR